jgi:hypothetical protein
MIVRNHDDLEPSPAELGETATVAPGEWTPLDDHGTQLYVYGNQPVNIAVQTADVDDEVRQLHAEVDRLGAELETMRFVAQGNKRHVAETIAILDRVEALTKDAAGGDLDGGEIVIVGKIRRALHEPVPHVRPKSED